MASSTVLDNAPRPSDLFSGDLNLRAAATVAFRYSRIYDALDAFTKGDNADDQRRRRWRIGLYREVVSHYEAVRGLRST